MIDDGKGIDVIWYEDDLGHKIYQETEKHSSNEERGSTNEAQYKTIQEENMKERHRKGSHLT